MSVDQLTLLAVLAAAGAAYLIVPAFRSRAWVFGRTGDAGPPSVALDRLRRLVRPVEGAPSEFARLAVGVLAACVLLPMAEGARLPAAPTMAVVVLTVFVGMGRWAPAEVRHRDRVMRNELPGVCTLLAVCLEAGLPLRNAVTAVAEASQGSMATSLRRVDTSVRLGVPELQAWSEIGEAQPAFADLARELSHAAGSGMALAPVLRHHALEAQRQAHGTAQARARKAGVNSVLPLMTCFLPAFILIGVVPIVGGVATRMLS